MPAISVVGYGMVTAVGFSGPATCAGVQAGIRAVEMDNLWDPTEGKYMGAGRPKMPQWWEGRAMLAELAAPAIEEALTASADLLARRQVDPASVPVLLVVAPPDRPLRWPGLDARALPDLAHKLGRTLAAGSQLVARGRTGIHQALRSAQALFARGVPFCVVAGVESFLRQPIVDHYIGEGRLLCSTNSNGFSPGEAAGAVLLAASEHVRGPQLVVRGTGVAVDPSGAGGTPQHPVTGTGLTEAVRQALAEAGMAFWQIDLRLSDANGEHFKFKEVAFTDARLSRPRPPSVPPRRLGYLDHWHPIEFLGEVGAAIFPILLGQAYDAGRQRHLDGPHVLLHAGEDDGERAAVVAEYRAT